MPDGLFGRVLCGDYPLATWGHTLLTRWPLLLAAVAVAIAVRLVVALLRRRRWSHQAMQARWLEITPPVTATALTTVALWRLLATLLPAPRWWQKLPPRLVWEVAAEPDAMRCGLWVPPGVSTTAVIRVLQRAWPGARIEHALVPELPDDRPVAAHQLRPAAPEWLPLIDDPPTATSARRDTATAVEEDRLRAVFDGLAAAGRTGGGLLQVHLLRAPRGRVATLRRATVDPQRARRAGRGRAAGLLLAGTTAMVRALLDLLTPGPSPQRETGRRPVDPYAAQLTQQARTKYGQPPHLLAAVYAAGIGPTKAAARAAAEDISSGYGLISAHLTRRRLFRARTVLNQRRTTPTAMMLVSVVEAAALAGLPTEPAAYGLPAAASRRRGPGRDTWAAPATGGHTPPARTHTVPDAYADVEDGPEPTLWSIP